MNNNKETTSYIKMIGIVLNIAALAELLLGVILLILNVWIDKEWISKMVVTDIILFVGGILLYGLVCYKSKDYDEKKW